MSTSTLPAVQQTGSMGNPEHPLDYPTMKPSALSEDAQMVYKNAKHLSRNTVDVDLLDPKGHLRYVPEDERKKFEPSQRLLAAIAELVAARIATYRPDSRSLIVTRVSKNYTVAKGRGSSLIKVYLTRDMGDYDGILLAVLVGGDLDSREMRGINSVIVRSRHETATDGDHDASSTAYLMVANPTLPNFDYGITKFHGVLTEANLYPLGVDPLDSEDVDNSRGFCDGTGYGGGHERHPFAPYMPPALGDGEKGLAPQFVTIKSYPIRPYLVADDAADL